MKRNKSTHVRKFDGVWYQIVECKNSLCNECDLFNTTNEDECHYITLGCYPLFEDRLLEKWFIWKEIGPK